MRDRDTSRAEVYVKKDVHINQNQNPKETKRAAERIDTLSLFHWARFTFCFHFTTRLYSLRGFWMVCRGKCLLRRAGDYHSFSTPDFLF